MNDFKLFPSRMSCPAIARTLDEARPLSDRAFTSDSADMHFLDIPPEHLQKANKLYHLPVLSGGALEWRIWDVENDLARVNALYNLTFFFSEWQRAKKWPFAISKHLNHFVRNALGTEMPSTLTGLVPILSLIPCAARRLRNWTQSIVRDGVWNKMILGLAMYELPKNRFSIVVLHD